MMVLTVGHGVGARCVCLEKNSMDRLYLRAMTPPSFPSPPLASSRRRSPGEGDLEAVEGDGGQAAGNGVPPAGGPRPREAADHPAAVGGAPGPAGGGGVSLPLVGDDKGGRLRSWGGCSSAYRTDRRVGRTSWEGDQAM